MFCQRDLTAQMQRGSMLVQVREFMGTCGNVFLHFLVAGRIYFLWFVIYSAAGWLYEATICSQIKYHKFINRGYLRGPWIPIYGAGAVLNYWLIGWIGNVPAIFVAAMFTSGVVEYITSYAMERMFHKRWWDYTRYRYNLNGRICSLWLHHIWNRKRDTAPLRSSGNHAAYRSNSGVGAHQSGTFPIYSLCS